MTLNHCPMEKWVVKSPFTSTKAWLFRVRRTALALFLETPKPSSETYSGVVGVRSLNGKHDRGSTWFFFLLMKYGYTYNFTIPFRNSKLQGLEPEQRLIYRLVHVRMYLKQHNYQLRCVSCAVFYGSRRWVFGDFTRELLGKAREISVGGGGVMWPIKTGRILRTRYSKQPFFIGCFSWMTRNHYIKKRLEITKHRH